MKNNLFAACVVALGLALLSIGVFCGLKRFADKDRAVCVKGLSTRDVQADYVVWPLSFSISGDDLGALYSDMSATRQTVIDFLKEKGFAEADLTQGNVTVNDNWKDYYNQRPQYQYTLTTSIVVSTKDVELVKKNNGCQSELLNRGIILSSNDWQVDYQFNGLSELKPEMIEEATKNARAVAQKFADDAECKLGSIQSANQGQFSVDDDQYQPWIKHVRVVTTIAYYLD